MSESNKQEVGSIGWVDLTVGDADKVRDFYKDVVGWKVDPFDMGGYNDYCMNTPESGKTTAGVCHARGTNAGLPPNWLIYITVKDVDASAARCVELGGKVITRPKDMGSEGRYCVIEDPAGAVAALFAPADK